MNLQSLHWYLAVVNTHKREIQILDSMLDHEDRLELRQTVSCNMDITKLLYDLTVRQ